MNNLDPKVINEVIKSMTVDVDWSTIADKAYHNLSDKKMEEFKKGFDGVLEPAFHSIYGVPLLVNKYMPEDEMWFFNRDGKLIKRFQFV